MFTNEYIFVKNASITYIFDQRNSFNNLIDLFPSSIFKSSQKTGIRLS